MTRYRICLEDRHLAPGTINGRLAAVRRLAYEASDAGLLSPELAAGIRRVKGVKKLGVRLGNWLTASEARQLLRAPEQDALKGKRDRAILAVLRGCGLRRRELADLDFAHLRRREEHWAIVDLVGKGGHIRTVPVPDWIVSFRRPCVKGKNQDLFGPNIRRTEVLPISRRREISDLLTPWRNSFRTLAALTAAVAGLPRRVPLCRPSLCQWMWSDRVPR